MKQLTSYNRVAGYLNKVFDILNEEFFESELSRPTITIQSTPKAYGHFSLREDTWVSKIGGTHEINIGAGTLSRPIEEVAATLLHEMVHYYNYVKGVQDCSRGNTYHNRKFRDAALAHGLIVDHHDKYGWTITTPSDDLLYSTIVCDLLLKLKELSDVYNDKKAEKILKEINEERKKKGNSAWEWELIETIRERTELLSDESYAMIDHIYDLRNFSAHPAMNDDYELISPSPEMTVAYIKKALEDILVKPSVFADSIVHRMSDDISSKKERYRADIEAFEHYLNKVYFQRMSAKMVQKVFKAFWKFAFIKTADDGEVYPKDRYINRKTLEAMLNKYHYDSK